MKISWLILVFVFLAAGFPARAGDLGRQLADRAAVERVYYHHRLGTKPAFEQVLPAATLARLVELDGRKEAVLRRMYGVEITPAMVSAEVERINATTQAPEVLAELKAALDGDPARFAQTVARPIVVERELHRRFDNDDRLHAAQRKVAEKARAALLAARNAGFARQLALLQQDHTNEVTEMTWQLAVRPTETNMPTQPDLKEIHQRFGPAAQLLSGSGGGEQERKFYFADLPGELQTVLRAQLRQAGDVSAVIETPGGFLLYVVREKTPEFLAGAGLNLPKRGYEEWVEGAGR